MSLRHSNVSPERQDQLIALAEVLSPEGTGRPRTKAQILHVLDWTDHVFKSVWHDFKNLEGDSREALSVPTDAVIGWWGSRFAPTGGLYGVFIAGDPRATWVVANRLRDLLTRDLTIEEANVKAGIRSSLISLEVGMEFQRRIAKAEAVVRPEIQRLEEALKAIDEELEAIYGN